jgi:hypothetical protein
MARILSEKRACIVLSTHGSELKMKCREILTACGYKVHSLPGFEHEIVAEPVLKTD